MSDLRKSDIRKIIVPGQSLDAAIRFNTVRGFIESGIETFILENPSSNKAVISTFRIFEQASQQGINFAFVFQETDLESLILSPEAKARIAEILKNNRFVYVPIHPVVINGKERFGWYEFDLYGNLIGVTEDGGHQVQIDWGVMIAGIVSIIAFGGGVSLGWTSGKELLTIPGTDTKTKDKYKRFLEGLESFFPLAMGTALANVRLAKPSLYVLAVASFFLIGLGVGGALAFLFDPPLPDTLIGLPGCDISPPITEKGVTVQIVSDEIFTVSFEGTQIPTSFRVIIRNLGSTRDTFTLQFPSIPAGFEIQSSLSTVTIEAGQSAEIGVYLRPVGTLALW